MPSPSGLMGLPGRGCAAVSPEPQRSVQADSQAFGSACRSCLQRSHLLMLLSARIDHAARDTQRLLDLLALDDLELIEALGGRRRRELREMLRHRFEARACHPQLIDPHRIPGADRAPRLFSTCAHQRPDLQDLQRIPGRPSAIHLAGAAQGLEALHLARALPAVDAVHPARCAPEAGTAPHARAGEPPSSPSVQAAVAFAGAARASDYGMEAAFELSRSLAGASVLVIACLQEGIGAAALAGALAAGGQPPLGIAAAGLDVSSPKWLLPLRRRLLALGCLASEMPSGAQQRRWSRRSAHRLLFGLSALAVVVEADTSLACQLAAVASAASVQLGAVPGRITSPGGYGPNQLIASGRAALIASPQQALELLYRDQPCSSVAHNDWAQALEGFTGAAGELPSPELDPEMRRLLHRIRQGDQTLQALAGDPHPQRALLALARLESLQLVARGDGGRYVAMLPSLRPSSAQSTFGSPQGRSARQGSLSSDRPPT